MAYSTTSLARWRGADRSRKRQRPQLVGVVKCTLCGSIYDAMPRDPATGCDSCPTCKTGHGMKKTCVKD